MLVKQIEITIFCLLFFFCIHFNEAIAQNFRKDEIAYAAAFIKSYGKDKVVDLIQSERKGHITLLVGNDLVDFSGRPGSDYVTTYTVCIDIDKIGWNVVEFKDKLIESELRAKREAERLAEVRRKQEEYDRKQIAKGLVKFKGRWLTPAEKRECEYEQRASELIQTKAQRKVAFKVLQPNDYGSLCIIGRMSSYSHKYYYDGEVFLLLGVTKQIVAEDEKFISDLYWAGTHTYKTVKGDTRTVNCFSFDIDTAKSSVRIKFGLYDKESRPTPGYIPGEVQPVAGSTPSGFGSGFIITDDGYLITNHHVVEGVRKVQVRTQNRTLDARIIETDPDADLALLKVEGTFTPVTFSSAKSSSLGQTIFTVGFPMPNLQGFSPKVTKGVISSLRGIKDDVRTYQIDASVQPGNSGGPLADEAGNIIGVIVARLSDAYVIKNTGSVPQNVNYAVKKSYLMAFLNTHPWVAERVKEEESIEADSFSDAVEKLRQSTALVIIY